MAAGGRHGGWSSELRAHISTGNQSRESELEMRRGFYIRRSPRLQWHTSSSKSPLPNIPKQPQDQAFRPPRRWATFLIQTTTVESVHLKCWSVSGCLLFWFRGNPWGLLFGVGIAGVFLCMWSCFPSFVFQYDMMGRNQTAVREEMIRLANYLDSVSCISLLCLPSHSLRAEFKMCYFWALSGI